MVEISAKIIGAALPLLASLAYGRIKIRDLRRGLTEISAFLRLVRYIGDNVEHFMKPIPEIIAGFEDDYLESVGFLQNARDSGLLSAWQGGSFLLSGEGKKILDTYFTNVGGGYLDDEKKLTSYTEKRLEALLESETVAAKDKERIYKTVPPMLAGSVVLILI